MITSSRRMTLAIGSVRGPTWHCAHNSEVKRLLLPGSLPLATLPHRSQCLLTLTLTRPDREQRRSFLRSSAEVGLEAKRAPQRLPLSAVQLAALRRSSCNCPTNEP